MEKRCGTGHIGQTRAVWSFDMHEKKGIQAFSFARDLIVRLPYDYFFDQKTFNAPEWKWNGVRGPLHPKGQISHFLIKSWWHIFWMEWRWFLCDKRVHRNYEAWKFPECPHIEAVCFVSDGTDPWSRGIQEISQSNLHVVSRFSPNCMRAFFLRLTTLV